MRSAVAVPKSLPEWNKNKFPGGAEYAVKKIKSAGMRARHLGPSRVSVLVDRYLPDIGKQHPDWFVHKPDGKIYQGGYGIWTLNTKNKEALDAMVRPLFRELATAGLGLCEDRRRGRYAALRQGKAGRRPLPADRLNAGTIAPRLGPRGPRGTRPGHLYSHLLGRRSRPMLDRPGRRLPAGQRRIPMGHAAGEQLHEWRVVARRSRPLRHHGCGGQEQDDDEDLRRQPRPCPTRSTGRAWWRWPAAC